MEYIKNISENKIELLSLGVELEVGAEREVSEFANRSVLQNNASYLCDLVYNDKIVILDADRNQFSKVEAVQYISNAYTKVIVDSDNHDANDKWYFVRDEFILKKKVVLTKTFLGNVESLYMYSSSSEVTVGMKLNGLVMPVETLDKRQRVDMELKGKANELELTFESNGTTTLELYIDGYSVEDTDVVQTFIDNWRE